MDIEEVSGFESKFVGILHLRRIHFYNEKYGNF